jgi:hypothetical protein
MPQVPTNPTPNKTAPTQKTAAPAKPAGQVATKDPLVPPEPEFWQKYSPHNEFSLSGATSLAVHILGLGILLLLAYMVFKPAEGKEDVPEMDQVAMKAPEGDEDVPGKTGGGSGPGDVPKEDIGSETPDDPNETVKSDTLTDPPEAPKVEGVESSSSGTRIISSGSGLKDLQDMGKRSFDVLVNRKKGKGGGGKDTGYDVGEDKGYGADKGGDPNARRRARQLRWRVVFNQNGNGDDYLDKLYSLGAIVVVAEIKVGKNGKPLRNNRGEPLLMYRLVIRDLSRTPAEPKPERVEDIPGIFWIDDKPGSVASLAASLGLEKTPPLIACFFKRKVEEDLRRLEREKYSGPESKIEETHFRIVPVANGPYRGNRGTYRLECVQVIPK